MQPQRQPVAALGLGAHVQPQAVALHPAFCQPQQRLRRPGDELEFDLAHRLPQPGGRDVAAVESQLHGRAAGAHAPQQALDVGAVALLQRRAVGQQRGQLRPHRGAGVPRGVGLRAAALRRQRHFVLQPLHQAVAAALERLHPARAFLAQAQRQAGRGQALVGGVQVDGLQPHAARAGGGHGLAHGGTRGGGHLELQLDFHGVHGAHARACGLRRRRRLKSAFPLTRPDAAMPFFWKPYKSDVTSFIEELKAKKPTLEDEQRAGRALLWDRDLDRPSQAAWREARVPQQAYVYQTRTTPAK